MTVEMMMAPLQHALDGLVLLTQPIRGAAEGATVVIVLGVAVGGIVGRAVGAALGVVLSGAVGTADGRAVGTALGFAVGAVLGAAVGIADGRAVGTALGVVLGGAVGTADGTALGVTVESGGTPVMTRLHSRQLSPVLVPVPVTDRVKPVLPSNAAASVYDIANQVSSCPFTTVFRLVAPRSVLHVSAPSRERPRTSAVIVTALQPGVLNVIVPVPVPSVRRQFWYCGVVAVTAVEATAVYTFVFNVPTTAAQV